MASLLLDPAGTVGPDDGAVPVVPAAPGEPPPTSILPTARLAVACLGLVALCLGQQPGKVVADTKLDLVVDPWGFLTRALRMWEPQGFAGHIQDQAYGYLFPMGPFFGLGESAGLPAWVVQRLWMGLVLCVAFLGFVALARRLGIGTPETALVGGLAYALAPRMLTELGAVSVEAWPMALAPWVLVPLVTGARTGSPRRAAALSGLAVFCVGGVNAVATATVLPLAALWLLTRPAGPRRRRLIGWWIAAVALATAWWAGPLLLLGRYSPPFLDYIENAATTTAPTELVQVLRGTSQWVAYLATPLGPQWPAGWALAVDTVPVVGTVALAAAGLLALTVRGLRHRSWLVLGLLAGLVLVTLGHVGTVSGLGAEPLHRALDGVLAPLRNVHKFDPVLRLPLTLALVHLATVLVRRARRPGTAALAARAGAGVLALALVAVASPAIAGKLTPPAGFDAVPGYWQQAADWLADEPDARALLLPASRFGTYVWGSTGDEPMQPLARSQWEVRDAVPFTPAGHIRMLDAVEDRLGRGEGSAGLARYLARSGISYLVVRNDLDTAAGATRPLLVHRALDDSPGIRRVAAFGPVVGLSNALPGLALDSYLMPPLRSVEIFAVDDPAPRAWTAPLGDAVTVLGGPDGVLALEEHGLLTDRPALTPDAGPQGTGPAMVTDALVRRERSIGSITGAASAGLAADDPLRLDAPARDYLIPGQAAAESVVRLRGATVSASSSGSDPDSLPPVRPEEQPFAALDGDPGTAWWPAGRLGGDTAPDWWRVRWDEPRRLSTATVTVAPGSATGSAARLPVRLRLTTDAGERTVTLAATGDPQRVRLPAGRSRGLTVAVGGAGSRPVGLAEVSVPGPSVVRSVVTPSAAGPVDAFAFDASGPATSGCVPDGIGTLRCATALVHGAEEPTGIDRAFSLPRPAAYDVALTAVPRPGPALDALIAGAASSGLTVTASSQAVPDPRAGAEAAVDGDVRTTWTASGTDAHPALTLRWDEPQVVDTLTVRTSPVSAAAVPDSVTVQAGWISQSVRLDQAGVAHFAAVTTDELVVSFPVVQPMSSYDPYRVAITPLGVGVTELSVPGARPLDTAAIVEVPCGQGPVIVIDGTPHDTWITTTVGDLRSLRPVAAQPCDDGLGTGRLDAGEHRFAAASTGAFAVGSATLTRTGAVPVSGVRTAADVRRWDAEHRVIAVPARDRPVLLAVAENQNAGWHAVLDGRELQSRTIDGWQQGYVVPAGAAGQVHLDFGPGTTYRAALLGGLGAVLLLVGMVLVPGRGPVPVPVRHPAAPGRLAAAGPVAGVVVVGGPVGAVALAALGVLCWAVRRWHPGPLAHRCGGAFAAGALMAAGVLLLLVPGAAGEPARQTLAVLALAATVVTARARRGRSGTRPRNRWSGRSTST